MGLWMSRLLTIFGEKEARILVLGLDNAGKTTILCKFICTLPFSEFTGYLVINNLTVIEVFQHCLRNSSHSAE